MNLRQDSRTVGLWLARRDARVVLAESCTGGLVAASLAQVPGISDFLCGSAVTYRNQTKHGWLQIPAEHLVDPGPVSELVAREMALGVLRRTPEATVGVSVTGHLGPHSPEHLDGVVYIGMARRRQPPQADDILVNPHRLATRGRVRRQREAARLVLNELLGLLVHWD